MRILVCVSSELPQVAASTDILCDGVAVQPTELPQHAELPGLMQDAARSTDVAARQCAIGQSADQMVRQSALAERLLYAPVTPCIRRTASILSCEHPTSAA